MSLRANSQNYGSRRIRLLARLSAAMLVSAFALTSQVKAAPIKYAEQLLVLGCGGATTGALGNVSFADAFITFTFIGDTDNVLPFSVPLSNGYENLLGTATVTVTDLNLVTLAQGTFLPSAGIFVSVDNANAGIGFGSFGVLPSNSSFPGQPVYPAGLNTTVGSYDLRSDFNVSGYAISCVGFGNTGPCGGPIPLPTTGGDFYLNSGAGGSCPVNIANGSFQAQTYPLTPFSAFKANVEFGGTPLTNFEINGAFTLGNGSNGINPVTDVVTLQIGGYSVTIPSGSFTQTHGGTYVYAGKMGGVALEVRIAPMTKEGSDGPVSVNSYSFQAEGSGANLAGTANPVTVVLTIGDDSGTTTASP